MLINIDFSPSDVAILKEQAATCQTSIEDFSRRIILKEIKGKEPDLSPFFALAGNIDIDESAVLKLRQGSIL